MNEKDDLTDKIFGGIFWIVAMLITLICIGILFLPAFIPTIRRQMVKKYEGYTYQKNLVKEEMAIIVPTLWTISIIAWILFTIYVVSVGL